MTAYILVPILAGILSGSLSYCLAYRFARKDDSSKIPGDGRLKILQTLRSLATIYSGALITMTLIACLSKFLSAEAVGEALIISVATAAAGGFAGRICASAERNSDRR